MVGVMLPEQDPAKLLLKEKLAPEDGLK